ncbi:MAG: oligosaccharide flippase family protein [Firmicutes bacterium]|nr:oligosaccharide flippase family protein [Bacillota bacterium]
MAKARQGLFWGTLSLLIANVFVKGLGFFYRVAMVRIFGAEGMGLIEMATPLFSFLLVLSGAGISLALSQSVAAGAGDLRQRFSTALILLGCFGAVTMLAAFVVSPYLAQHLAADARILPCLRQLLPALLIISSASAFRGWFQGQQQVAILGWSQCVEQCVRVAVGLTLAQQMIRLPLEQAVCAASIATVAGEAGGFLLLLWRFHRGYGSPGWHFSLPVAGDLLRFGLPVTAGRLASSALAMGQSLLIPLALQLSGLDTTAATTAYGLYSGVAMSLLHLPGVFTSALVVSVVPAVAAGQNQSRALLHSRISKSLQATAVFTLPGIGLLWLLAPWLCAVLFHSAEAAPLLRLLCPAGVFIYLQSTCGGILQGLGKVRELLHNSLLGGGITLLLSFLCTWRWGISGTAVAAGAGALSLFLLNRRLLIRATHLHLPWAEILYKPAAAVLLALAAALICGHILPPAYEKTAAIIAAAVFVLIYAILLLFSGIWDGKTRHS